jgi:hypothetical protein
MKPLLKIGINEITREGITSIFHRLNRTQYNHYKPLQTEMGNLCVILGGPYNGYIHKGKINEVENYGRNTHILFIDETHFTKYEDVVDLSQHLYLNRKNMQFIFKETDKVNENNCVNRFSQNTSFKQIVAKSIFMNDKYLPKSVYGYKYENPGNYQLNMHYTGLTYHNSIEHNSIGNNIFNYYKQSKTKSGKFICTSGAFMSSDNSDCVSYYKPHIFEDDVYLNDVVDVFLENIRNNAVIDYDAELYWKTHFICNVAKISTQKKKTIYIPLGITINESLDFIDELKSAT